MKTGFTLLLLIAASCLAQENAAPKNELAFGLGGISALARNDSVSLDAGSGVAFQVNYGRRFLNRNKVALYGEINFIASPLRDVSTAITTATHDFASLYVTPGIRVKLRPASRIPPYAAVGGGYGDYEQSLTRIDGRPNQAPRELARGVFDFGAGADVVFGDSSHSVAKLATITQVRQITMLRPFPAGSTISSRPAPSSYDGTDKAR